MCSIYCRSPDRLCLSLSIINGSIYCRILNGSIINGSIINKSIHCRILPTTAKEKDGASALWITAFNGQLETAQILIDCGADVNQRSVSSILPSFLPSFLPSLPFLVSVVVF